MRYLTLMADYTESAVRDDFAGALVPEEVGLSYELGDRIRDWNVRYRAIIPLSPPQRREKQVAKLIDTLDEEGLALVQQIETERPDFKVRYYSEGHLRYLK